MATMRTPLARRTTVVSGSFAFVFTAMSIAAIIGAASSSLALHAVQAQRVALVGSVGRVDLAAAERERRRRDDPLADRVGDDLEGVVAEPAALDRQRLAAALAA